MSPRTGSCGRCAKTVVIAERPEGEKVVLEEVEPVYRLFSRGQADVAVRFASPVYLEHEPRCPGASFPEEEALG